MKNLRLEKIKKIIEQQEIETQEELANALKRECIEVTQATISRDIKSLMLIKVPIDNGRYRYAFPSEQNAVYAPKRLQILQDSIISINFTENIIIVRTLPGTAEGVAVLIDNIKWPEIAGSIAGDNTIFIAIKPTEATKKIVDKFNALFVHKSKSDD